MDNVFLLLVFVGAFSLALVAGEGLIALWRIFRQRVLFPRNRWF